MLLPEHPYTVVSVVLCPIAHEVLGEVECVALLQELCIQSQDIAASGYNPLHLACKAGNAIVVALLLQGPIPADAAVRFSQDDAVRRQTGLHFAC